MSGMWQFAQTNFYERRLHMEERTFRINEEFTDSELATIIAALNFYAYNNDKITQEVYDLAMEAMVKVLDSAEIQ